MNHNNNKPSSPSSVILSQLHKRRSGQPSSPVSSQQQTACVESQLELNDKTKKHNRNDMNTTNNMKTPMSTDVSFEPDSSLMSTTSNGNGLPKVIVQKTPLHNMLYTWHLVLGVGTFVCIVAFLHIFQQEISEEGMFDFCMILPHQRSKTENLLFKGTTILILLSFLVNLLKHGTKSALYLTSFVLSWYHVSWGFVIFFKQYLNDRSCSRHPNSVSGHYHYFVFAVLTLPFLFNFLKHERSLIKQRRNATNTLIEEAEVQEEEYSEQIIKTSKREVAFYIIYGSLLLFSILTMLETYREGYHSLRQVLYGIFLAVTSHFLFISVLLHLYTPHNKMQTAILLSILFVIMIVCNITTQTVGKVWIYNAVGLGVTFLFAGWLSSNSDLQL